VPSTDSLILGGLNKLDPQYVWFVELIMIQSTTGLGASASSSRRLQSVEQSSLFALGMGRNLDAARPQEQLRQGEYSHGTSGSFRIISSSPPVGSFFDSGDHDGGKLALLGILAFCMLWPQLVAEITRLVILLCCNEEGDQIRSARTRPTFIGWSTSLVACIIALCVLVFTYGDISRPTRDILVFPFFLLFSIIIAVCVSGLREFGFQSEDHQLRFHEFGLETEKPDDDSIMRGIFLDRIICMKPTSRPNFVGREFDSFTAFFVGGLLSIIGVAFWGAAEAAEAVTAMDQDNEVLLWSIAATFFFAFLCYRIVGLMWYHRKQGRESAAEKTSFIPSVRIGTDRNQTGISPFGCVIQQAHGLPIGAARLKTAGVTRPPSRFKLN